MGVGHGLLSTTVYTVEVSSVQMRGSFAVLEGVLRSIGLIAIYSLGALFDWDHIAYFAPAVPLVAFFLLFFSPESPVHLVSIGDKIGAEKSLAKLNYKEYDTAAELKKIVQALDEQKQKSVSKINYIKKIDSHPEIYKPFFIILLLSFAQQFSGATAIRGYVVKIFGTVFSPKVSELMLTNETHLCRCECLGGPPLSMSAYYSAIIIGCVRLAASLSLTSLLVKFKRRSLYLFSALATMVGLLIFGSSLFVAHNAISWGLQDLKTVISWSSVVSACFLVFCVNLGVQPMPNLMSSELFPPDVRALCKVRWSVRLMLSCHVRHSYLGCCIEIAAINWCIHTVKL